MTTKQQKKGISLTIAVIASVIAILLGIYFANIWQIKKDKEFVNQFPGTIFGQPRHVSQFDFAATDGKAFNNARLKGHWTLVFFGFTNCPVLCPTSMSALAHMYQDLEKADVKNLPQVVLVSLDPPRDNQAKLKNYVTSFNPNFIGALSDTRQIKALTRELGIAYMKDKSKDGGKTYNIQHSGAIMIFNPNGNLQGFYALPHKPEVMAKNYQQLIKRS